MSYQGDEDSGEAPRVGRRFGCWRRAAHRSVCEGTPRVPPSFEVSSLIHVFPPDSLFLMIFGTNTALEMRDTCHCFQHNGKNSLRNKANGLSASLRVHVHPPACFSLSDDP